MAESSSSNTSVNAELNQRVALLFQSMAAKLGIRQAPKIIFSQDTENAKKPFGMTGYYDPATQTIRIFITGRHPTDILRTFAHELIHHWQNERGTLKPSTTGQEHYAQKDPTLRQREKEAYLLGNLLFRDWQDECRYGKLNENKITKSELKKLIKERITILFESGSKPKMSKDAFFKTWTGKYDNTTLERLWQRFSNFESNKHVEYYDIGFKGSAICWIWDPIKHIVISKKPNDRQGHNNLFGNMAYQSFRGRYDTKTHKLSITVPDGSKGWTDDIKKDVPPDLLADLNKTFKNPEMHYFPYRC